MPHLTQILHVQSYTCKLNGFPPYNYIASIKFLMRVSDEVRIFLLEKTKELWLQNKLQSTRSPAIFSKLLLHHKVVDIRNLSEVTQQNKHNYTAKQKQRCTGN